MTEPSVLSQLAGWFALWATAAALAYGIHRLTTRTPDATRTGEDHSPFGCAGKEG